jgi:heavy metal translocating P-type ATPase
VVRDAGPVYFEVGCVVLVLVTLGRWLEATGKLQTTAAMQSLHQLLPDEARLVRDGTTVRVPADTVGPGDCLRVQAGERFPCDGQVQCHQALVDEQVLTGESQPVPRGPGDRVLGGTLNLDGDLLVVATAPAGGGALARLIELVRQARESRGRFERLADRVASVFLPGVVLVALAAAAWHTLHTGLDQGILSGLAVLLIACPCALGLATPMAVWAALGQAARARVLFRNSDSLERLAGVRAVCFDKTGTLTTGSPVVAQLAVADGTDRTEALRLANALASSSAHPSCAALRHFLADVADAPRPAPVQGAVRTASGLGLVGTLPDQPGGVYLGNVRWMRQAGLAWPEEMTAICQQTLAAGQSLTCLGWQGRVQAIFVLREQLRPQAAAALARLAEQGCDVAILTGDHAARGLALAQELQVPVYADLLPQDKVAALRSARQQVGPVAMVGDGINDAPALAGSDVGIALGCGADVSRDSAAVCLLGNDPAGVPWALELARQTVRVIRQNLLWAFVYNVAGIALACTGRLNPTLAALAMALSSFLVVANSLRLTGRPASAEPAAAAVVVTPSPDGGLS